METSAYSSKSPPVSTRSPRAGFALVIALSLMAFILLLLLSITTLVRVESQSAEISLSTLKARQNAMLGAMIAVGELQKYAGPDQRATATADLLRSAVVDSEGRLQVDSVGNQLRESDHAWTGVWMNDTNADGQITSTDDFRNTSPRLVKWLVSGNTTASDFNPAEIPDEARDNSTLTDDDHIWLVRNSVNQPQDRIQVLKEDVIGSDGSSVTGKFAYWVGDEGVKAYLGKGAPESPDPWVNSFNLTSAQTRSADLINSFNNAADDPLFPESDSDREKFTSLEQVGVYDVELNDDLAAVFHDVSFYTEGVLSDAHNGGLKKDLSVGLQAAESSPLGSSSIFPSQGSGGAVDPGGATWNLLRSWYNTEKNVADRLEFSVPSDTDHGFFPIVRSAEIQPFFTAQIDPSTPPLPVGESSYNGQDVYLNFRTWIFPIIVLWNPYPFDLEMPTTYLRFSHNYSDFSDLGDFKASEHNTRGLDWKVSVGKERFIPLDLGNNLTNLNLSNLYLSDIDAFGSASDFPYLDFEIQATTLPAGKAVMFAASSNQPLNPPGGGANVLAPFQTNREFGFYLTLPTPVGGPYFIPGSDNVVYDNNGAALNRLAFGFIKPNGGTNWDRDTGYHALYNSWALSDDEDFKEEGIFWQINQTPSRAFWHFQNGRGRVYIFDDNVNGDLLARMSGDGRISYHENVYRFPMSESLHLNVTRPHNRTQGFPDYAPNVPWLAQYNPRAPHVGASPIDAAHIVEGNMIDGGDEHNYFNEFYRGVANFAGATDSPNVITDTNLDRWRYREPNLDGTTDIIYSSLSGYANNGTPLQTHLFDIPNLAEYPITSIGQLSQADLSRPAAYTNSSSALSNEQRELLYTGNIFLYGNYAPAFAVGNSLADPRIAGDSVFRDWSGVGAASGYHYDYSYLLNEALWDTYFFSTVDAGRNYLADSQLFETDVAVLDSTSPGFEDNAAALRQQGTFNVNSTSLEAWKALLGAFKGIDVPAGHPAETAAVNESPFPRFNVPPGSEFEANGAPTSVEAYQGFRSLDDVQIEYLAQEIVKAIKRRRNVNAKNGPFVTLAEFVNRDLNPGGNAENQLISQRQGVLHEALNPEGKNPNSINFSAQITDKLGNKYDTINDAFIDNNDGIHVQSNSFPDNTTPLFDEDFALGHPTAMGIPGFLMQSDLLSRIGHVLSARSDTFVIRAYGSAEDGFTGSATPTAQAWCEVVVQRTASPISPDSVNINEPDDLNFMGRKFEIVSLRWLTSEEI